MENIKDKIQMFEKLKVLKFLGKVRNLTKTEWIVVVLTISVVGFSILFYASIISILFK